jgi:hypothetical protein
MTGMTKTIMFSMVLSLTGLMAKPNVPMGDMKVKMAKMAGESSPFNHNEDFPKEYFLIPHNLPYLVGLSLHHPMSSTLGLSKEQIEKIGKIKADTLPQVLKEAKEIKTLELKLVEMIRNEAPMAELDATIEKIGTMKTALSKKHLRCIEAVRAVLSKEQRKKLFAYASAKPASKVTAMTKDHKDDAK